MGVLARGSVAARALAPEVGAEARLEPRRRGGVRVGRFEIIGGVLVLSLPFLPHGFDVIGSWDRVDGSGSDIGRNLGCWGFGGGGRELVD